LWQSVGIAVGDHVEQVRDILAAQVTGSTVQDAGHAVALMDRIWYSGSLLSHYNLESIHRFN